MSEEIDRWGRWIVRGGVRVLVEPSDLRKEHRGRFELYMTPNKTEAAADGLDTIQVSITLLDPLFRKYPYTGQIPIRVGREVVLVDMTNGDALLEISSYEPRALLIEPDPEFRIDYQASDGSLIPMHIHIDRANPRAYAEVRFK